MKSLKSRINRKYTRKEIYKLLGIEESEDDIPPFFKKKKNTNISDVNQNFQNLINNKQKENDNKIENNNNTNLIIPIIKNNNKHIFFIEDQIIIPKKYLKSTDYEKNIFELIAITPDGNCLYRSISYFIFKTEDKYMNIRTLVYNYLQ